VRNNLLVKGGFYALRENANGQSRRKLLCPGPPTFMGTYRNGPPL